MAEPEYPVLKELETKLKLQWVDTDDYMATQRAIIEVTPDHAYLELPRGRKGDKGDPGNAISFQGIVARTSDLPTGLTTADAAKAWVNTATKALHVWNGNQWFTVNNFAGVDADVQRFSQWFAQAADAARTAVDAADRAEYWANETIQQVTGDFATREYADSKDWHKGAITDAHQTMADVGVGAWNIAARPHAVRLGLPMDYGSLQVMQIGLSKAAFFIGQSTGFWINSSNGDVWGDWQRHTGSDGSGGGGGAAGLKTVAMALTAGSLLDGVAGRYRVLAQVTAPVVRWRIHVESHRMLSNTTSAFTLGNVYIGNHSGNGAITGQRQIKSGNLSVPAGSEWASPWLDASLLANETLIDLNVTGSELYWSQATSWVYEGGAWVSSKNSPVSIWVELETFDQVPVVGMIGDSTGGGQGADRPVFDSALYIAARKNKFIPMAYTYPGSSMQSINDFGFHLFQRWAHLNKPDSVIIQSGSNDIHAGTATAELRTRFADLVETAEMISPVVIGATVKARYPNSGEHQATLDAHNAFVKTRSNGNRDYVDFYQAVSPTGTVAAADAADAAHLSTSGHQKLATAFDTVTVARPSVIDMLDTDPRIPNISESPEWSWAVTDGDSAALGVTTSGDTVIPRIDDGTRRMLLDTLGPADVLKKGEGAEDYYPWRVADEFGVSPLAIRADGAVDFRHLTPEAVEYIAGALPPQPVSDAEPATAWAVDGTAATYLPTGQRIEAPGAVANGPALTWDEGGTAKWLKTPDDGPWRVGETLRWASWGSSSIQIMGSSITDAFTQRDVTDFHQGGVGGDRTEHILGRMGVRPWTLAESVTIPTSGAIAIDLNVNAYWSSNSVPMSIEGIHGVVSRDGSGWSFTRTDDGESLEAPVGTPLVPDALPYRDAATILNIGKNDISYNSGTAATVFEAHLEAVAWLRSLAGHHVVIGHYANNDWPDNDGRHLAIRDLNAALADEYGTRFIDLEAYVMGEQVWVDTGITPTAADLEHQSRRVIPPSLASDAMHTTSQVSDIIVDNLIFPHLENLGWI